MARKPYVPLNQKTECKSEKEVCNPKDRDIRAMVSADHGNSIQQRPDGLYAPAIVYRENTVVDSLNEGIRVQESQTEDGFRKFDVGVRISLAPGNTVVLNEDGVFVPENTEEPNPVYIYQGGLSVSPLVPGEGTIFYENRRNIIRILNGINNIVLPLGEDFEEIEEVYLVQDGQRDVPVHLIWPEGVTVDNVPGPNSRSFSAGSSIHLLRHRGQQWLVLAGGGVDEAPFDNRPYTRKNGIWVQQHSQVLPALILGRPDDEMPLDVTPSQFNRIVEINDRFSQLDLKRQYVMDYQDDFEATFTKNSEFLVTAPMGVKINGFDGPIAFRVEAKPRGCVLKRIGTDEWLILGSAQQDGAVTPLPPITTLEFPGSGDFKATARLLDGTILYDMSGNTNVFSSVHALKNLIIACIVIDQENPYLDMKDCLYLDSYKTGLTGVLSPLQEGDLVSYRDLLSLLLYGGYEDIAVMISSLIGEGDHAVFTDLMNTFVAQIETPLTSSFYGAATSIADPVGISNTYKIADWLQHIEEEYTTISNMLRQTERVFTVFGPNSREITVSNQNEYLTWSRVDMGLRNDLENNSFPFWGLVQKLEMPADLPVYISMHQFPTELERHLNFTSALMGLEDDFPFLTGGTTDFDNLFTNVTLLLGNSVDLVDRSNIANQVFNTPTGVVKEERDNKGWIRSWALNGSSGAITVYDNPSLRLGDEDFTLEMFFRGNGAKNTMVFFAKDGFDADERSYMLRLNNLNLEFVYTWEGGSPQTWTIPISVNVRIYLYNAARKHICIQREGDSLGLYLNGRLLAFPLVLPADASFQDCALPLNFGCNGDPVWLPVPDEDWFGRIKVDNVRLTKGVARYPMTGFPVRTTPFKTGSGS